MATYKGLLCDLDGTLADSEPLHREAWLSTLQEKLQLTFDEDWFEQWVGTSDHVLADSVLSDYKLDTSKAALIDAKHQRFYRLVRERGRSFPGVTEALGAIAGKYPLAIATNSGTVDTDVVIPALGLDRFTDTIVTATDVENLKPAPDIYLLAARRLGLPAEHCIAIEDSKPGGRSAKSAGCYLIGLDKKVDVADEWADDNQSALKRALELLQAQ